MTSGNDRILSEAGEAPEEVVSVGAAPDGPYLSPNFFFNPATGAYEPTVEFIEVGRKSLAAAAKRINRDSKRRQAMVFIPFSSGRFPGLHAASLSFMAGVIPPMPMFGRSLL